MIAAFNWALDVDGITPAQKLVLANLANYANEHCEAYPAHETLARRSNQSVDSVQRNLKVLCDLGLLFRLRRHGPDGRRLHNRYIVLMDDAARERARAEGWTQPAPGVASSRGGEDEDVGPGSEAEPVQAADCGLDSQAADGTEPSRNQPETKPHCCGLQSKAEPSNEPSLGTTPLPPSGGVGAPPPASSFDDFRRVWPFDACDLVEPARKMFAKLSEAERFLAVKWASAYLQQARAKSQKKMSGANWLRGKGWQAFHAKPESAAVATVFIRVGTPQWVAWEAHHRAIGSPAIRNGKLFGTQMRGGFGRYEKSEWPPSRPPLPLEAAGREAPS
jgi:hypothetical protein